VNDTKTQSGDKRPVSKWLSRWKREKDPLANFRWLIVPLAVFVGLSDPKNYPLALFICFVVFVILSALGLLSAQDSREKEASQKVESAFQAYHAATNIPSVVSALDSSGQNETVDRKDLERRALFDLYSKQIEKYQIETRGRAIWSFAWAVIAMLGGLTLLLFGAWHVFTGGGVDAIPVTAVTIVGSAVSGFIAKTFLDAHQTSLIQLNHYFKQPVLNSHILTAQRLVELLDTGTPQQDAIKQIIAVVLDLIPAEQAQSATKLSEKTRFDASKNHSNRQPETKNSDEKPESKIIVEDRPT
jgi:hypothetical protein